MQNMQRFKHRLIIIAFIIFSFIYLHSDDKINENSHETIFCDDMQTPLELAAGTEN